MATPLLEALQEFSTYAMTAVIWVVQLVQYPGLRRVPSESFSALHRHHCVAITPIVAPLMMTELAVAVALLLRPGALPVVVQQLLLGCVLLTWFSTATMQVPIHRRLARQRNERDLDRLIHSNWIRTAAWSAKTSLLLLARFAS